MLPKPTLEIAKYEGLVTVFALMLAVEYASERYDLWDIFIGLLSIYIGSVYWKSAKENTDFLYSSLTASLISLGILTASTGCIFVIAALFGFEQPSQMERFWIENIRFIVFGTIASGFYKKLNRQNIHINPIQPPADASAD